MMQSPGINLRPTLWRRRFSLVLLLIAAAALLGRPSYGQVPDRLSPSLSQTEAAVLRGSLHPLARAEFDQGRASASTKVPYMTMVFSPSASQQAALTALLAAQQNPASPAYHKWLTPAQFGAQFGMSSSDIATARTWLESQGFTVLDVANARNAIHFSGTAAQVESAFHTEMHQYLVHGTTTLANSTALSLPSGLASAVSGIGGVAGFRPRPLHSAVRRPVADALSPQFTSSISGGHYVAPDDITTIYDIKALYNAGFTGAGQNIGIVGQSQIVTTDLDAFRTAAGLPIKEPIETLVPNTGASTIQTSSGDESESDIDLEWSGAIAENATIQFVYAGASGQVFDALRYAIDTDVAPVVSVSYGECEEYASTDPTTFEPLFMEANAQGQTILSSAGDSGATGCDVGGNLTITSATQGLAVSYPASSPNVTAMGGTQFNEGSGSYWNSSNDSLAGSAISYIPEQAWNETAASDALNPPGGLSSTGGGASILFGKPSWQVATGVPADGARDVPDISLDAAAIHDAFLFCSGGYCTNGFRYSDNTLTTAGGTSFDAPIFAAILTLINQKNGVTTGAGNINPKLYTLYGTASAASAFHDITVGDNKQPCTAGSIDCPTGTSEIGFAAGLGYDQATGLGSIDAYNLAQAFAPVTVTTGSPVQTSTTLTASTSAAVTGTAVTFTAVVTPATGNSAPTGTVNFVVDGATAVPITLEPTVNGSANNTAHASYAATFTTTGSHTVTATYAGDSNNVGSSASQTITVASSTTTGSFTLAASNVTVASGSTASSTVTVTAVNGYTGTVGLTYSASASFTGCVFANDIGVGGGTVTATILVDDLASACVSTGARHLLKRVNTGAGAGTGNSVAAAAPGKQAPPSSGQREYPIAAAALLAGLAVVGRKRKAWPVAVVLMLAGLGTLSGCGGSSGTSVIGTTGTTPTTYTITLVGTDNFHTTQTASTTFTVTVN